MILQKSESPYKWGGSYYAYITTENSHLQTATASNQALP